MRYDKRLGAGMLLLVLTLAAQNLSAQTLAQAEALWKARRFKEANDVFKQLEIKEPKNPDYKVRWGRMMMDHAQPTDAQALFGEALEIKKDHAGALMGMAILTSENFDARAADLAKKALESDPKLVEAQELLARIALEDNNNSRATEEAKKALAMDANSDQGKAILATIDWLADKKETAWDPHTARGYETVGHFFVMNRRYEEGIQYYRKAIELDPQLYSARSQLGVNLMRLGQNDEAYKQLKTCFDNDYQDLATRNSLTLMDSYKNFVTFTTPTTILKLHKKEAELLRPYFQSEMERAMATYEKKYKLKLEKPVQVEVYPDHEDFAVRTLGMPGLGALGVTFGYAVAMDSPSGRKPGTFHWASTLWHEMSHVYTLTATGHRVPRWFTEGLAVHEETAISPDWGDRLSPDVISAIKNKKLLSISELDRGFVHPTAPGTGHRQLFPGRPHLRLHQRKMGLGYAAGHAARFRRRRSHPRRGAQGIEGRAGRIRHGLPGLRRGQHQECRGPLRRMEEEPEVDGRQVECERLGRRHQGGHRDPRPLSRLRRRAQRLRSPGRPRTSPRATSRRPSPNSSATKRSADAIRNR